MYVREAHEEILYVGQHMYTALLTGPELEELVDLPTTFGREA